MKKNVSADKFKFFVQADAKLMALAWKQEFKLLTK